MRIQGHVVDATTDVAQLDCRFQRERTIRPDSDAAPGATPTRPMNPPAACSLPSAIFSGRPARGRGAGPKTTCAPSRGSYSDSWQGHAKCWFSAFQPVIVHCAWVQIAEN